MHELLAWIGKQAFAKHYYLAGGTALALQVGHRISVDLDFFSETNEVHARTRQTLIHVFLLGVGRLSKTWTAICFCW